MKIEFLKKHNSVFADTNIGDVFEFTEDVCMRIQAVCDEDIVVNTVELATGRVYHIRDEDKVILLPNAVLQVN
jgi:hypothetical protein